MELTESKGSYKPVRPDSLKEKNFEPRSVVVAVDATKELKLAALQYALRNFIRPGDKLYLLGILHQVPKPRGFKHKADLTQSTGPNKSIIQEAIRKKKVEFEKAITDPELQKLVQVKEVIPIVHIAAGPDRKVVTAGQVLQLRATWLILDRNLKKEKRYLMEQVLNCNLVMMKPKTEAAVIRRQVREQQGSNGNHGARTSIVPWHFSETNNHAQSSPVSTPRARIVTSKSEAVEVTCSPRLYWKAFSNSPGGRSAMKSAPRVKFSYTDMLEDIC